MRKLWTDHIVWTRDYIIAAVGDQPDAPAALNRPSIQVMRRRIPDRDLTEAANNGKNHI